MLYNILNILQHLKQGCLYLMEYLIQSFYIAFHYFGDRWSHLDLLTSCPESSSVCSHKNEISYLYITTSQTKRWLSIRQIIYFHSILMVQKIRKTGKPVYFADKFTNNYQYDTRISRANGVQLGPVFRAKKSLTMSSWRWYSIKNYNFSWGI